MSDNLNWLWVLAALGALVPVVWKQLAKMGIQPWFPIAGLVAGILAEELLE